MEQGEQEFDKSKLNLKNNFFRHVKHWQETSLDGPNDEWSGTKFLK
jgi:hypothetical protein